jgi:3-hydroxybutyrate dehydrogenase/3-oxoacyl-[acyl-carrier protein] reductase
MGLLDGKVALVTGGTRGIGRGIAEGFLAAGACVVVNGRSREKGERALAEMGAGDNAHFLSADVSVREDCEALVDATLERYGAIHILVNNAGGADNFAPVHELTDESMNFGWTMNVMSTFWCCRRALPHMIAQQWGRIINVSSIEGKIAKPAIAPYVVAKHALNGLTKTIAVENATIGITSNALCPGAIETDMMKEGGPGAAAAAGITYEQFLDSFASASLIKRLNTVEEVAAMATLLASDAGGGITGQCINVDGGSVIAG